MSDSVYREVQIFGMVTLEDGDQTLADSQFKAPEFFDVLARQFNDDTGEVDILEEIEDISDYDQAVAIATQMCERHGVEDFDEV